MKGKILLGLALTSMISTGAFAVEIKNGKLIKHKEWSTGNMKGAYVNKSTKADLAKFKEMLKKRNITMPENMAFTFSGIDVSSGVAGERTDINGMQFNYVMNNTDGAQVYIFSNSICAQTSDKTHECMFYTDEVQLDPYGEAWELQSPTIQPVFTSAGTFYSFASSYIAKMDDDSNMFYAISGSGSEGRVVIN